MLDEAGRDNQIQRPDQENQDYGCSAIEPAGKKSGISCADDRARIFSFLLAGAVSAMLVYPPHSVGFGGWGMFKKKDGYL